MLECGTDAELGSLFLRKVGLCTRAVSIAVLVFLASCTTSPSAPIDEPVEGEIPWQIHARATRHAERRLGADFFDRYYTLDEESSGFRPPDEWCLKHPDNCHWSLLVPRYTMVYDFVIPELPFVRERTMFHLWESGAPMDEDLMRYGFPDCGCEPAECEFPVDEAEARRIAKEDHLEPGIQEWSAGFTWYGGDFQTYTWSVSNFIDWDHGKGVTIDANSGEILARYFWIIVGGERVCRPREDQPVGPATAG